MKLRFSKIISAQPQFLLLPVPIQSALFDQISIPQSNRIFNPMREPKKRMPMARKRLLSLVPGLLMIFVLLFSQQIWAQSGDQISNQLPSFSPASVSVAPSVGGVVETVNIVVPNGRGGIQPNLSLNYSSSTRQGILGVGWSLELGHIERSTKRGVPKYNDSDSYLLISNGGQQELIFDNNVGFYRSKIEGGFSKIVKLGNEWIVTDKSGIKYHFGSTTDSQQYDAGQPGNVFQWFLSKVEDIHGNYMALTYVKDNNQIYPQGIIYTGNQLQGDAPFAELQFILEDRNTSYFSYSTGFLIKTLKRISRIIVKAENIKQHEYEFVYSQSQSTNKDLLVKINQYASDGASKLPPINFSYSFSDKGFIDESSQWSIPADAVFSSISSTGYLIDLGVRIEDVSSDGYPDILVFRKNSDGSSIRKVYINDRNKNWNFDSSWTLPEVCNSFFCTDFMYVYSRSIDLGLRLTDMNGDGRPDFVLQTEGTWMEMCSSVNVNRNEAYINTGNNWSSDNSSWYLPSGLAIMGYYMLYCPQRFQTGATINYAGTALLDVNNDGYSDAIKSNATSRSAYLNAMVSGGTGWNVDSGFTPPSGAYTNFAGGAQLVDLNGDGLPDIYYRVNGTAKTYLNTGRGWQEDSSSPWDSALGGYGNIQDGSTQFGDINGDGLVDMIIAKGSYGNGSRVFINTGYGWMQDDSWVPPAADFTNLGTRLLDADSDGMLDYMIYPQGQSPKLYISKGIPGDLLIAMDNGIGGKTNIEYDSSTHYANIFLPFPFPVAKTITTLDLFSGDSFATTYQYAQGLWSPKDREFRGFGYVKIAGPGGNYVETEYLQGEFTKGMALEQRTYDAVGNLYSKVRNTWNESQEIAPGSRFVHLQRKDAFLYDGGSLGNGKRTAEEYFFEEVPQFGNLTRVEQYGEVDLVTGNKNGTDVRRVKTEYINDTTNWIIGLPSSTRVEDYYNNTLRKTLFYYDAKGLLTKKEDWAGTGNVNPVTLYSYDAIGNLATTTDPKGNVTRVTYDTTYNMFSLTTENAMAHKVTNEYFGVNGVPLFGTDGLSGLWGQVKSTTDPNQQQGKRSYDMFGRLVAMIAPLDSVQYPTQTTSIEYGTDHAKVTTRQRVKSGQAQTIDTVSFYDGLGRLIQTKTPSEVAGRYVVSGQAEYNSRGLVSRQYLPFFSTSALDTIVPIDPASPHSTIEYEPMGRVKKTINPDGTYASVTYDAWATTTINENGHMQKSYVDAFGRLIKKEEYTGVNPNYTLYATTLYTYDSEGNLIQTRDAYNNTTTITYDVLGRKKSMTDPDMGPWTYDYDLNGNLIKQIDAKGQTLNFAYDALNRLVNKNDGGSLNVSYVYDDATVTNSKGRLTQATYTGGNTQFAYDELGRELQSIKTMNTTNYGVTRGYDALNNLLQIQYPDQKNIYYKYNGAGQIEAISNDAAILPQSFNWPREKSEELAFKYEIRSTKHETKSNDQNINDQNKSVLDLKNWDFEFASDFGFRISNLTNNVTGWLERNLLGVGEAEAAPAAPVLNTATAGNARVDLGWGAVSGATGYKVKYGTISGGGTGAKDFTKDVDCVAGWKFNEASGTVTDSCKTLHGTVSGTLTRGVAGKYDSGIEFLGYPSANNAYVNFGSDVSLDNLRPRTLVAWIRPDTLGEGSKGTIFSKNYQDGWVLRLAANNNIAFSQAFSGGVVTWTTTTNAVAMGVWQHVAVTYTGSGTTAVPVIYINGAAQTAIRTGTPSGTIDNDAAYNLVLGIVGTTQEFDGRIDEAAIFKRILTSTEIAGIMNNRLDGGLGMTYSTQLDVGNVTGYTVTGLTNGTTYYFVVSAKDTTGESPNSNELSVTPVALPAAPVLNAPVVGNAQVSLSWSAVTGATGYKVYYGTAAGQYGTPTDVGNTLTKTVTNLTNGTVYYFAVTTYNAVGQSVYSNELSATPVAPSTAPVLSTAVAGDKLVTLTWAAATGATGYKIYYGTATGVYGMPTDAGNVTTKAVTGLTNGTAYYFAVTAYNAGGESPKSNEKSAAPVPPVSCNSTTVSNCVLPLTYSGSSAGTCASGYTGACSYSCSNGTWSASSNNCTLVSGSQTTATFQQGVNSYTGSEDLTIWDGAATTNQDSSASITVKDGTAGFKRTGLMRWNISSIPSTATIVSVKIDMVLSSSGKFASTNYIYPELRTWGETTATWNTYNGTNPWGTVGSKSPSSDMTGTWGTTTGALSSHAIASNHIAGTAVTFPTSAAFISYVQSKLTTGSLNLVLHQAVNGSANCSYYTSENATATNRPKLTIVYTVPTGTAPTAPTLNSATPENAQVTLNWNAAATATGYKIYYGTTTGQYGPPIDVNNVTSSTVTGLTNGTVYYFAVTAYNATGESVRSNERSATPMAPPPAPVVNAPVIGDAQITLSWSAATGATGYKIYYGTAAGVYGTPINVGNSTTSTMTGLANGTRYYFAVKAYNTTGDGVFSNEVNATPVAPIATEDPTLFIKNVDYNAAGQMTKVEYGNGDVTTYTYNELNLRLTRLYTVDKNGTALQDLNYTYDPAGNILSITDNVNTADQTFQYDELNRLTQAVGQSYGTKTYTYDKIGNIVEKDGKTYFYGGTSGGPHAVTALSDGTTFSYDANGNMITKVEAGVTTAYTYDAENRLTKVVKNGSTIGQYEYDGDGGRTKKTATVSGATTTTTFVGSLFEIDSKGRSTKYVFLGGQRVASITSSPTLGTSVLYYHTDHLGGANILTDATGFKKELIEYEPFGQESRHEKYGSNEEIAWFYFTGKKVDDESGLYYYGARYYDPKLGRFLTPDIVVAYPDNPQSFNRYSYVHNNPVNYIDPTGHFAWLAFFAFAAKAAAVVSQVATVVSIATTAVGLITQNQSLLNIGQISGYVGLGTGLAAMGISSVVAAKAAAGSQLAEAITLDTIHITSAGAQAARNAGIAASAREVLQQAIRSSVGALVSTGAATAASIGNNVGSAASYWAYESAVPGPFGQPMSEWQNGSPTSWGDPMRYTEQAGGGWMWAERAAFGIAAGATVGAFGANSMPYWRYVGPNSNPDSRWLSRGWKPPYGDNFEAARNALQIKNPVNAVERARVPWYKPVAGPRPASGLPEYGEGGGLEWYRGINFPKN